MTPADPLVDRSILIFAIWAVLGFLGLGVFLEGLRVDHWALSAAGIGLLVLAFAAHIVVNGIFNTGFGNLVFVVTASPPEPLWHAENEQHFTPPGPNVKGAG